MNKKKPAAKAAVKTVKKVDRPSPPWAGKAKPKAQAPKRAPSTKAKPKRFGQGR